VARSCCFLILAGTTACGPDAPPITGREWRVVALGDRIAPVGAGGRPLTMNFDYTSARVSGFAGCNQYNAPYVLAGDSLIFGPAVSTMMACEGFDSLELAFLASIPAVAHWQFADSSTLVLSGPGGVAVRLADSEH
jgi:heat shock protein HslJ